MSLNHTFNFGWTDGGTPLTGSVVLTGILSQELSATITANTANNALGLAFTAANLQSAWISANTALTIKTNNTSAPQDTITITASDPFTWYTGSGVTIPFSNNVTQVYATNGSNTNSALNIRLLTN